MPSLKFIIEKDKNKIQLLYKVFSFDKEILDQLVVSDKNINQVEQLSYELDRLPPSLLNPIINYFPTLFEMFIHKNNKRGIVNILNIYNKYRIGLDIDYLINHLLDNSINTELRLTLGLTLSNHIQPNIDFWNKLVINPEYTFLIPAAINKFKFLNPKRSLEIFVQNIILNHQITYIPVKRAIINLLNTEIINNYLFVNECINNIKTNKAKYEIIISILNLPELKDAKEKLNSIAMDCKPSFESEEIKLTNKKLLSLIKSKHIHDFTKYFENSDKTIILQQFIELIKSSSFDNQYQISSTFLDWLQSQLGSIFYITLFNNEIDYDQLNGNLILSDKVVGIGFRYNDLISEYSHLGNLFGHNRINIIHNILQNE